MERYIVGVSSDVRGWGSVVGGGDGWWLKVFFCRMEGD